MKKKVCILRRKKNANVMNIWARERESEKGRQKRDEKRVRNREGKKKFVTSIDSNKKVDKMKKKNVLKDIKCHLIRYRIYWWFFFGCSSVPSFSFDRCDEKGMTRNFHSKDTAQHTSISYVWKIPDDRKKDVHSKFLGN